MPALRARAVAPRTSEAGGFEVADHAGNNTTGTSTSTFCLLQLTALSSTAESAGVATQLDFTLASN